MTDYNRIKHAKGIVLYQRKPGGPWYLDIRNSAATGKRVRLVLGTAVKEEAILKVDRWRLVMGDEGLSEYARNVHLASKKRTQVSDEEASKAAKRISYYTKWSDGRKGFTNDLTVEFIERAIRMVCSYCGVPPGKEKMTLDRMDNSRGHSIDNVLPACYRCNVSRGDMPFQVWMFIAPRYREARALGLFDGLPRSFVRKIKSPKAEDEVGEKLLTVNDVAVKFSASIDQVRDFVKSGDLKAHSSNGQYLFSRKQLEDFLELSAKKYGDSGVAREPAWSAACP
jgi:hypothetical protein